MVENWKEYDKRFDNFRQYKTRTRKCDECGEKKPCKRMPDPFLEDVYGETAIKWLCYDCYCRLLDEI